VALVWLRGGRHHQVRLFIPRLSSVRSQSWEVFRIEASPFRCIINSTGGRPRNDDAGALRVLDGPVIKRPIGCRQSLGLIAGAALVVSDSWGVEEEAGVLKRPVIVVRNSTERPRVINTFSTRVNRGRGIGSEEARALDAVGGHLGWLPGIECPYGGGHASEHTARAMRHLAAS
jgi:UDP-N-acetylglucosamine 2-epimerase